MKLLAEDLDTDDLRPSAPTLSFPNGTNHKGEEIKLPIPAFFDDFVLVVTAPSSQELIPKCARVLDTIRKSVRVTWHGS